MSEGFPVFIGITGKRKFSEDPQQGAQHEQTVRERLAKVFDYLDRELPNTPKILLTGAAAGADLIAAEEVLFSKSQPGGGLRRNWLVLAVLPFDQRLYEQDFQPEEWGRLQTAMQDQRMEQWTLPNLKFGKNEKPLQADDLERRADASDFQKDLRRRHYEQVGLWIADQANVLLAVMPSQEPADRIGGTARIVAIRRGGRPDQTAAEEIKASGQLAPRSELHRPPRGYVWLIDPAAKPGLNDPPVTVLAPATDATVAEEVYLGPGLPMPVSAQERVWTRQDRLLNASLKVFKMAKDYAEHNSVKAQELSWQNLQASCAKRTPSQILNQMSRELRPYAPAQIYRIVIYWLISLFLLAVLTFEVFAKYMHESAGGLSFYLGVLFFVIGLLFYADWHELQPTAEDRRALREALRVQSAWWHAGLKDRVDHVYLIGAEDDLAPVRDAARSATVWALLKCCHREKTNWNEVFVPHSTKHQDWVGEQLHYFNLRTAQRKRKGELFDATSWSLFATAAGLAILLYIWLMLSEEMVHNALRWVNHKVPDRSTPYVIGVLVAASGLCWWLSGWFFARSQLKWQRLLISIGFGFPAAVLLFSANQILATIFGKQPWLDTFLLLVPSIVFLPYWASRLFPVADFAPSWIRQLLSDPNEAHPLETCFGVVAAVLLGFAFQSRAAANNLSPKDAAIFMTIVYVIFLPALGGAMRFLSEKLAIEAEAFSYADARCWFAHAAELLTKLRPGQGNAAADEAARDIVKRLGALALEENVAWLKARRQRPLSPVG
jgi:hypothetical protein